MNDTSERERHLDEVTAAVKELVELMRRNSLARVDVEAGDVKIKLRAGGMTEVVPSRGSAPVEYSSAPVSDVPPAATGHVVTSPMIGTFYTAPAPGDPPFVRVGDHVDQGQTIGIIEAMKIMNEIAADRAGTVVEFLVSNAQAVEYGSPLLRLSPDEPGA